MSNEQRAAFEASVQFRMHCVLQPERGEWLSEIGQYNTYSTQMMWECWNGIQIVRRDMAFAKGYVTCSRCACNYNASNTVERTFCQIYSRRIDPTATEQNIFMAESCDQWVPDGLDRNQVITPDHTYWYEDFDPL